MLRWKPCGNNYNTNNQTLLNWSIELISVVPVCVMPVILPLRLIITHAVDVDF